MYGGHEDFDDGGIADEGDVPALLVTVGARPWVAGAHARVGTQ